MADDLAIPQLAEGQVRPDITANDATGALARALSTKFDADLTAGNVVVTAGQYRDVVRIRAINVATTGRTVTLPAVKREFMLVESDPANTNDITLIVGSTSITLSPGRIYLVRTDGTTNGLAADDIGGPNEPADFISFVPGLMSDGGQLLYSALATRTFTLPVGVPGSYFYCRVAVTADTTVTINKNGTPVGTAKITAAGTTGVFTFTVATTFIAGTDKISITGPATADVTGTDFSIGLKGKR